MSYYNHFTGDNLKTTLFSELEVNDQFYLTLFKGKRRRGNILMIKVTENTFQEKKNKIIHNILYPEKLIVKIGGNNALR